MVVQLSEMGVWAQHAESLKGGKPHSAGLKSNKDCRTWSAIVWKELSSLGSGTITTDLHDTSKKIANHMRNKKHGFQGESLVRQVVEGIFFSPCDRSLILTVYRRINSLFPLPVGISSRSRNSEKQIPMTQNFLAMLHVTCFRKSIEKRLLNV